MINKLYSTIILGFLSVSLFGQISKDSVSTASDMILKSLTGDISGTLTVPINTQTSPVVLIIAGSGPTDRNCNSSLGLQTNAYKMLAEAFAMKGISTLRFDKRGIGKSKTAMISESDLRFEDYITDVVSWINLLKADNRFSKIIVLGHSEGSLIGMIAAQKAEVAGFISAAGAGKSADKILEEQLKTKLTPPLLDESNQILDSLRQGKTVSNVNPSLFVLYRPSVQPYLISWMKYDPATEISKLSIPVLIIEGTTDIQVSVEDAKLLAAAKPDAKLLIIDNMNHIMKESSADLQTNIGTYQNPDLPLKPGVSEGMTDFILSLP